MRRDRLVKLNFQERAKKERKRDRKERAVGKGGRFVDGDSPIGIPYNAN